MDQAVGSNPEDVWCEVTTMADEKRAIYAEDLLQAIIDDPYINGANFARIKEHIDECPTVGGGSDAD